MVLLVPNNFCFRPPVSLTDRMPFEYPPLMDIRNDWSSDEMFVDEVVEEEIMPGSEPLPLPDTGLDRDRTYQESRGTTSDVSSVTFICVTVQIDIL